MEGGFRVAITGTPGVGKTSVSRILEGRGFTLASVEDLAEEFGCIGEVDPKDGARPIDTEKLGLFLTGEWAKTEEGIGIVDGHLSHNLPVDAVVVLRCSPDVLRRRLTERGYSEGKINSNYEWELLGGPWNEFEGGLPWTEFDTTVNEIGSVVDNIQSWISDGFKPMSIGSTIDWVAQMGES
jgi:adenylate kinase|tara:strand:- start:2669 stop:3214 length:546 start_codon:yes stop_codon:yes gene_type:complete